MTIIIQRDALHQAIDRLPEGMLIELVRFIEFLQFKIQHDEQISEVWELLEESDIEWLPETEQPPPFKPVYFPEGILKGVDFSPEYIAEARKELWAGFGEGFE